MDAMKGESLRRLSFSPAVSLGNLISPVVTLIGLGVPALIWGGHISAKVESLASSLVALKSDVTSVQTTATTVSSTLVGMNITISEGLKQTMADQGRRIVNLEQRVDKQAEEITRLQIELEKIRSASRGGPR